MHLENSVNFLRIQLSLKINTTYCRNVDRHPRRVDTHRVYRALSFICLGLVLAAIGWFYQRVLFRRQKPPEAQALVTQPGVSA